MQDTPGSPPPSSRGRTASSLSHLSPVTPGSIFTPGSALQRTGDTSSSVLHSHSYGEAPAYLAGHAVDDPFTGPTNKSGQDEVDSEVQSISNLMSKNLAIRQTPSYGFPPTTRFAVLGLPTTYRVPNEGWNKFTHEIKPSEEGWASRIIEIHFPSNHSFKAFVDSEELRTRVPSIEKCSYVRYGRQGHNQAFIVFDDIREAKGALASFRVVAIDYPYPFDVSFVPYEWYNDECRTSMVPFHGFETQVTVHVQAVLPLVLPDIDTICRLRGHIHSRVLEVAFESGDWKTAEFTGDSLNEWFVTVEFWSADQASRFLYNFRDGQEISLGSEPPSPSYAYIRTMETSQAQKAVATFDSHKSSRQVRFARARPTARGYGVDDTNANQIDLRRFDSGEEVRGTVMLRNIPNRMNCSELKSFIDQTCRYKYDFLYLRIDFENDCNVGYAFINFIHPTYVLDFYNKVHGHNWDMAGSSKTAILCYATTQGKEALVERFRNSCVSQKLPWMRPHLYISEIDWDEHKHQFPRKRLGDELDFPAPNNLNKLHRSMAIADEQGLFHNKDKRAVTDVRGYDRGNPNNVHDQNVTPSRCSGAIGTRSQVKMVAEQPEGPVVSPDSFSMPFQLGFRGMETLSYPSMYLNNFPRGETGNIPFGMLQHHPGRNDRAAPILTPSAALAPLSRNGFQAAPFLSNRDGTVSFRGFQNDTALIHRGLIPDHRAASISQYGSSQHARLAPYVGQSLYARQPQHTGHSQHPGPLQRVQSSGTVRASTRSGSTRREEDNEAFAKEHTGQLGY